MCERQFKAIAHRIAPNRVLINFWLMGGIFGMGVKSRCIGAIRVIRDPDICATLLAVRLHIFLSWGQLQKMWSNVPVDQQPLKQVSGTPG